MRMRRMLCMKKEQTNSNQNLTEIKEQKLKSDKMLLTFEIIMGVVSLLVTFAFVFVAAYVNMPTWLRVLLIVFGLLQFIAFTLFALWIEQVAGYYECSKCHHRYVPTFWQTLMAPHLGRSRKMKCPHCGKRNYHKKVISKE